jgi:hypothetical protein
MCEFESSEISQGSAALGEFTLNGNRKARQWRGFCKLAVGLLAPNSTVPKAK